MDQIVNALPLVALGRLTIKIGLAMLTPLHAPTSLDWGGVGWPHASGRYRHLRRPGCHSPFDGSHPSPERIQGTHLVSQSPTLKWVAGGVWDEFQKRVTAGSPVHRLDPLTWRLGWLTPFHSRSHPRRGTLCPLGGLRNPLWAPHSWRLVDFGMPILALRLLPRFHLLSAWTHLRGGSDGLRLFILDRTRDVALFALLVAFVILFGLPILGG